jgi:isopentenyldiphosphate isomerase
MNEDELLDLVDEDDKVTGTIFRSQYDKLVNEGLGYIRASALLIQNDKGELWIPKRTSDKRVCPSGLDCSMEGHVGSGESYLECALRECEEELNLKLESGDLEFIKKFMSKKIPYFMSLYLYKSNEAPNYNKHDYVSASWIEPKEIIKLIKNGTPAKETLLESVEILTGIAN